MIASAIWVTAAAFKGGFQAGDYSAYANRELWAQMVEAGSLSPQVKTRGQWPGTIS